MKYDKMEWLIWAQEVQELIPTQEIDWNQVKILESNFVQEVGPNREAEALIYIHFSTMECDFARLVIQIQDLQV